MCHLNDTTNAKGLSLKSLPESKPQDDIKLVCSSNYLWCSWCLNHPQGAGCCSCQGPQNYLQGLNQSPWGLGRAVGCLVIPGEKSGLRRTSCLPQRYYSRACCPGTKSPLSSPDKAPCLEGWIEIERQQGCGLLWVLWGLKGLFCILPEETAGDGADQSTKDWEAAGTCSQTRISCPSFNIFK